jgi:hypothetical protein
MAAATSTRRDDGCGAQWTTPTRLSRCSLWGLADAVDRWALVCADWLPLAYSRGLYASAEIRRGSRRLNADATVSKPTSNHAAAL